MQRSPDWEIHIAVRVCRTDSSVLPNEKRMIAQNIHTPHWHVGKYMQIQLAMQIHHDYLNISQCSHNRLRLKCHLHHKSNRLTYWLFPGVLYHLPELPDKKKRSFLSLSLSLALPSKSPFLQVWRIIFKHATLRSVSRGCRVWLAVKL